MRGLPVKGVIVAGKRAFLPLSLTPVDPVFAVVDATGLMEALTTAFEILWTRAIPLLPWDEDGVRPAADHPAGYVDPVDRKILSLLLAGLTDDAVARTLGLGTRTVQRRIRALMDQFGAQTRLQRGWAVSQQGVLDPPEAHRTR